MSTQERVPPSSVSTVDFSDASDPFHDSSSAKQPEKKQMKSKLRSLAVTQTTSRGSNHLDDVTQIKLEPHGDPTSWRRTPPDSPRSENAVGLEISCEDSWVDESALGVPTQSSARRISQELSQSLVLLSQEHISNKYVSFEEPETAPLRQQSSTFSAKGTPKVSANGEEVKKPDLKKMKTVDSHLKLDVFPPQEVLQSLYSQNIGATMIMESYKRFSDLAQGYNAYSIVGALLFGFGVTALFEYDSDRFEGKRSMETIFWIVMGLTICFAASCTLIMTTQYYFITHLSSTLVGDVEHLGIIQTFVTENFYIRKIGRISLWASFFSFAFGICLYASACFEHKGSKIGIILVFALFTIFIAFVLCYSNEIFKKKKKQADSFVAKKDDLRKRSMDCLQDPIPNLQCVLSARKRNSQSHQ